MDAGSTWFQRSLERRLAEVRDEHCAYLVTGSAQDFANYRERVGYIRAIDDVLAIAAEVANEASDASGGAKNAKASLVAGRIWES